jgi:hypothetical protein
VPLLRHIYFEKLSWRRSWQKGKIASDGANFTRRRMEVIPVLFNRISLDLLWPKNPSCHCLFFLLIYFAVEDEQTTVSATFAAESKEN